MNNGPTYVDGLLVELGEPLFNRGPVQTGAKASSSTGLKLPKPKKVPRAGAAKVGGSATEIRSKLGAISKRTPEVMVKISGGGKGMKQIKDHLDYITRNGKLEAEDQDGNKLNGKEDIAALKEEWQYGGYTIPNEGNRREAFNIVLSMPAGTDELGVKRAARDFAERQFPGHQYVMVQHTYSTDPDPNPSKNPHVHLAVKATAIDGRRLNPRKADLQHWREEFAHALREHGIEAAATDRVQRLKLERGDKQAVRHMKDRGEQPKHQGKSKAGSTRVAKAKETERTVLRRYAGITKALAKSDVVEDRLLAAQVVSRLSEDVSKVRGQDAEKPRDRQSPEVDR